MEEGFPCTQPAYSLEHTLAEGAVRCPLQAEDSVLGLPSAGTLTPVPTCRTQEEAPASVSAVHSHLTRMSLSYLGWGGSFAARLL